MIIPKNIYIDIIIVVVVVVEDIKQSSFEKMWVGSKEIASHTIDPNPTKMFGIAYRWHSKVHPMT